MGFLRSESFWLSAGSIAFLVLMSFSHDFWMGFLTACILAVIWYAVDLRRHPRSAGDLKPRYMDYETGELRSDQDDSAGPGSPSP